MAFTSYVGTTVFEIPLSFPEVDYFRKAVCSVVRKLRTPLLQAYIATDLFYNHDDISGHPINRYPLIQYKEIDGRAAITGVNQGLDAFNVLLRLLKLQQNLYANTIHINGRDASLIYNTNLMAHKYPVVLLNEPEEYEIKKWLPLEEDRYNAWKDTDSHEQRMEILNIALMKQIAFFLKGIGYDRNLGYKATVIEITATSWLKEFNIHKLAFDCRFRCNLSLPEDIGIGQVPSIGFGRVQCAAVKQALFNTSRSGESISITNR
jgi:hypothetical protein